MNWLKSRRISEITVAEISRKAMLGRGTFYLHYKDIHDLLDTLENEYVEAIGNIIDEYYPIAPAANISGTHGKLFRYITAHEEQPDSLPPYFHTKLHRPPDYPPALRIQPSGGRRGL
ncbi:MAG: TetR/AcrR family transcriptional regulator [Dialister invisus]